jgi:hypothetical protein
VTSAGSGAVGDPDVAQAARISKSRTESAPIFTMECLTSIFPPREIRFTGKVYKMHAAIVYPIIPAEFIIKSRSQILVLD